MPRFCVILISLFLAIPAFAALTPEQIAQLPPAASHTVNFTAEVKPIFESSCTRCHGRGKEKGGFRLDSRETFQKGGDSGPAVVSGKSAESLLISLVQGIDPDSVMPKKGSRLTAEQIGILRAWIDQGVTWDPAISFGRLEPVNLKPHQPQLPPGNVHANPIDRLLLPYFTAHKIKPDKPVSDRLYAHRVYLDTIGLLPPPDELDAFVKDSHPDKRKRLVERLLADDRNYAEHWLTFWNDMLRNDYKGTGYIDGGRKQITPWLYSALLTNMPYNHFVAQLIDPPPEAEGFTKGIVWRGVVNASQTPQMQAAQSICQVFMGVNLKCASCHDSFVNDLTLADAYGLAGVYADGPLEMVQCDKPTGKKANIHFIYPELGPMDPDADKPARLKRLADIISSPQDGRLTRTLVNRLWQRFFGRGLVEPVDDMEKPAWSPDLLDWLAEDFANHNYDVKFLISRILTSSAYQLPSTDYNLNDTKTFIFKGPAVRRMNAEQFRDAIFDLTGIGGSVPGAKYDFLTAYVTARPYLASLATVPRSARWIWNDKDAARATKPRTLYFRKEITLTAEPTEATAIIAADDNFTLYVNGERAGAGDNVSKPILVDLAPRLKKGRNVIAISAENKEPKKNEDTNAPPVNPNTPAGLLVLAEIGEHNPARNGRSADILDFSSDHSWRMTDKHKENWEKPKFVPTNWVPAIELGQPNMAPWNLARPLAICSGAASQYGHYRASLVDADNMARALGRPNREQVVTTRPPEATTLQGIELTNGSELDELIRRGAKDLLDEGPFMPRRHLVQRLYLRALGRSPTSVELASTESLLRKGTDQAALQDLLWSLAMLPEFQLIY